MNPSLLLILKKIDHPRLISVTKLAKIAASSALLHVRNPTSPVDEVSPMK